MEEFTQRDQTASKSFMDIEFKHIFLFDNKFADIIFNNDTGDDYELVPGLVVVRDASNPTKAVVPDVSVNTAGLINIIGVISNTSKKTLADGADDNSQYCHGGEINTDHLILPDGVTLDTVPTNAGKTVGDILKGLGFELVNGISNTKFDN